MPLEKIKTQVLLLHSEQSTLDKLSTGFNDRYTVHCATSGTEALSTLGQVPIHVIVTAQDLPGMSGLDALREAKKRSPDTIGILLTGDSDKDTEALVGAREVFQVVRGGVTPESIRKLIDNATQQARLLALAESANDTRANPDEPMGEHIIMETSENGSTIITDATGRMPALNPARISASAAVGARSVEVLVLTKDDDFLRTIRDSARGLHNVIFAATIAEADEAVRKHRIGVAVIDAAMFGSKVEDLTVHLRSAAPRLVSIVAGRRDDGEMLMDLINRGKVYRFLLKPVSPGRARLAVDASVKYHLEAPDSAFKVLDGAGPAAAVTDLSIFTDPGDDNRARRVPAPPVQGQEPKLPAHGQAPKQAPKQGRQPESGAGRVPARKIVPKVEPKPAAKPAPIVATRDAGPSQELPDIRVSRDDAPAESPNDQGLGDAFGGRQDGLAETVTGIFQALTGNRDAKALETPGAAAPIERVGGFAKGRLAGIAAAAVVAVLVVAWFAFGGSDDDPASAVRPVTQDMVPATRTAQPAEPPPVAEPEPPAEPAIDIDAILSAARDAVDDGRIYEPPGDNAIELYLSAGAQLPGEPIVAAELGAAINQALALAEAALLERDTDAAAVALQRVSLADPANARLPFLNAQLDEQRLRAVLDEARQAIRESRFDDADTSVMRARALGLGGGAEIDAVAGEITSARIAEQVAAILAQASARLDEGALIGPENDSAVHYYREALSVDPENAAARQGLTVVAGKLVLQARSEIDRRNFDAAESLLADARTVDPASVELATATQALANERERVEQERIEAERRAAEAKAEEERRAAAARAEAERLAAEARAEAERRAAEERAAAERAAAERAAAERAAAERAAAERAAAEKAAAERAAAERAAAEKAAAEKAAAEREAAAKQAQVQRLAIGAGAPAPTPTPRQPSATTPATTRAAPSVRDPEPPPAPAPAVEQAAATSGALEKAGTGSPAADPPQDARPDAATPATEPPATQVVSGPVSISSLTRTKYVAPKYPRAAERRGVNGWVDVVFTVDIDGTVKNVEVRGSEPGDTFVASAIEAIGSWEFEPVFRDGVAVEQQAVVRLMFAVE